MRIGERQRVYGLVYGFGAYLLGVAITAFYTPSQILEQVPAWRAYTWTYLNANFVEVTPLENAFGAVEIVSSSTELGPLRAVPILVLVVAALMANQTIGRTRRATYIFKNSAAVSVGYLAAGALAIVISGARPSVVVILVLAAGAGLALYIGSAIVGGLTGGLPVLGLVSLGGVFVIGLLAIIGGLAVLEAVWPLIAVSGVGVGVGGALNYIARNAPR